MSGAEDNESVVILTTHATWQTRHGPNALKKWRMDRPMDMSEAEADYYARTEKTGKVEPDLACPYILATYFEIVWIDEAHEIKRTDGAQSLLIQWLYADFVGLSTATPDPNRIKDYIGYLKFIRPRREPIDEEKVEWGVDLPNFNLYTLD